MEDDKVKMFEEISELSNKFHSIHITSPKLLEALKEGGHICMCGGLIFTSFLPKQLSDEYHIWYHKKCLDDIVKDKVDELTDTINHRIIEQLNKKRSINL